MAEAGADDDKWEELFGDDAEEAAAEGLEVEKKDKKEKKEKKDKKEKKEKKGKRDRGEADLDGEEDAKKRQKREKKDKAGKAVLPLAEETAEAPTAASPGRGRGRGRGRSRSKPREAEAQPAEQAEPEKKGKKEKKDKKDKKEKKDKKDKKEKKEKKRDKEGGAEAEAERPQTEAAEAEPAADEQATAEARPDAADAADADAAADDLMDDIFNDPPAEEGEQTQPGDADGKVDDGLGPDNFLDEVFDDMKGPDEFAAQDDFAGRGLVRVTHLPGRGRAPKQSEPSKAEQKEVWPESVSGRFTKVLQLIKPTRALLIKDEDAHPYIQQVVSDMLEAAEEDLKEFKQGLPMVKKMQMLPKVLTVLKKHAFAEIFVTFDGCQALAKWLQCLPDGGLPNEHLRTELLVSMVRLPITKEALANCKDLPLGAVVKNLQNNPRETIANRKIAGALVQKWLKQVLTQRGSLDGDEEEAEASVPQAKLVRPAPETEESLRVLEEESAKRIHPTVPIIEGKEYTIKPLPRAQPVRREKVQLDTNRGKIGEVLKVMSRPNKRAWKPYTVSIAGRTVNAV